VGPPSHQRFADIIASAVAEEKSLRTFAVHPDDPVEALFWGAEDDMSPLHFALQLHKEFGVAISAADVDTFFKNHMKVCDLCRFIDLRMNKGRPDSSQPTT
jgi:hypothetical protein